MFLTTVKMFLSVSATVNSRQAAALAEVII